MSIKEVLEQAQKDYEKLFVYCKECKHMMFSDFDAECRKGIRGIINRNDGCIFGEKKCETPPYFVDTFNELKGKFSYKETDSEVFTDLTLNQQLNKWIAELKQETAKQILDEADEELNKLAVEYYNAGKIQFYSVCEVIHHKVISKLEKKYLGENNNDN